MFQTPEHSPDISSIPEFCWEPALPKTLNRLTVKVTPYCPMPTKKNFMNRGGTMFSEGSAAKVSKHQWFHAQRIILDLVDTA
jgi:hypothetical protein